MWPCSAGASARNPDAAARPRPDALVVEACRDEDNGELASPRQANPLPLAGKRPVLKDWQKRANATATSRLVEALPERAIPSPDGVHAHPFTSIVLDPFAADALEALVKERFEERGYVLVRFGDAPKRAIPFRTDTPFVKIVANLVAPKDRTRLGRGARRFWLTASRSVSAGIHPDTKKPYAWHGGMPGEVSHEDLPNIHEDEARALIADAVALLVAGFGYTTPQRNGAAVGIGVGEPKGWDDCLANIHAGREAA